MGMVSLRKQTINSVKWTTMQTVIVGITGSLLLVVKARFLSPEEFGYIAVILVFIGLIQLVETFGISQAIIQKDEISVKESSTLFYFNIALSLFLAIFLYAVAPLVAIFFSLPALENYLRIICIIVIITGPSLLFRAFLEKEMYFKQIALIELTKNLIILGATTIFLVWDLGVLGVIYAQIISTIFGSLAILTISISFKVTQISFYFNPQKLLPFLRFGFFVSAKQLMTFVTHRLDEILIGYFLAPEVLGIYHFGKNMLEKIRGLITMSFGKVLFPVFSKLKYQRPKLTFAYKRISLYIAFGAFPVFTGIAATAHLFVPVLFGEQWTDSIIVFQVFSVAMIPLALTANVSSSLLYSLNKPELVLYIDVVTNLIYFISLFLFAAKGMLAILTTYSCYVIYKTLILQYFANRQLVEGFLNYFKELVTPAAFSIIMVVVVLIFQIVTTHMLGDFIQFSGSIIIGAFVYLVLTWFFAQETLLQLRSAVMKKGIN